MVVGVPDSPHTLAELIDLALTYRGVRWKRDLERVAVAGGYQIVHTTLASIHRGTYRHRPTTQTLEALAFLAGVSYDVAHRAAGLGTPPPRFAEELPEDVDLLSLRDREATIVQLRAHVHSQRRIDDLEAEVADLRHQIEALTDERVSGAVVTMSSDELTHVDQELTHEGDGLVTEEDSG